MSNINEQIDRMKQAFSVKTNAELAQKLDISKHSVPNWQRREKIPEKIFLKCAQKTNSDLNWLITGENVSHDSKNDHNKDTVDIPILKIDAGAGEGVINYHPQQAIISLSQKYFPFVSDKKCFAVEIVGNSMEPELLNGDIVVVSPQYYGRASEDGIYAIRIDGMVRVKSLHFRLDGTIDIISINSTYPTEHYDPSQSQVDFEIIGRKVLRITRQ